MLDCLQHVHLILYGWFLLLLWLIDELNSLTEILHDIKRRHSTVVKRVPCNVHLRSTLVLQPQHQFVSCQAAAGHAPPYQRKSSQQNLYLPPNLPRVPPTFQAPRPCPFRPH
eukprot:jgi/Chrzof1/10608/Cz05g05020.t1